MIHRAPQQAPWRALALASVAAIALAVMAPGVSEALDGSSDPGCHPRSDDANCQLSQASVPTGALRTYAETSSGSRRRHRHTTSDKLSGLAADSRPDNLRPSRLARRPTDRRQSRRVQLPQLAASSPLPSTPPSTTAPPSSTEPPITEAPSTLMPATPPPSSSSRHPRRASRRPLRPRQRLWSRRPASSRRSTESGSSSPPTRRVSRRPRPTTRAGHQLISHEHADPRRAFERHTAGSGSAPDGADFDPVPSPAPTPGRPRIPEAQRVLVARPLDVTRAERDATGRAWRTDQRGWWWGSSAARSRADAPTRRADFPPHREGR